MGSMVKQKIKVPMETRQLGIAIGTLKHNLNLHEHGRWNPDSPRSSLFTMLMTNQNARSSALATDLALNIECIPKSGVYSSKQKNSESYSGTTQGRPKHICIFSSKSQPKNQPKNSSNITSALRSILLCTTLFAQPSLNSILLTSYSFMSTSGVNFE